MPDFVKTTYCRQAEEVVDDGSESPLTLAVTIKNEFGQIDLQSITAGMVVGFRKCLVLVNNTYSNTLM